MPVTSIQRDQNNNVSLVRMISTDSLAAIDGTDYIAQQQETINQLNGGTWQWFLTDMILIAADDGNAFFEFIDDTFTTLTIFGSIGSGIINPGMQNQLPYYSANGRVLSPLTNMANAILATNGGMVPGLTQTLPTIVQTNITSLGTIATGVWNGTPVTVPFGGSGLSSLTAYAVLCGGTTSTGNFQQVSGLATTGFVLTSNGAGALPTWQVSAGSGTVSPGLQNQLAYYATNGSTVSGLTSIASGVLITSGLGVPSISQTLPSAVQSNITALGTIASGIWQATVIGALYGGTGLASPTAHGIMIGEGASPMTPIVLTTGQILIGSTGVDPVAAAIGSGTGILVGNGAGSITVALANASNNTIKSNISGISAAPVDNTLTAIIDSCIGNTQGNVLYRNATSWVTLAPGTSGQFLTTGGAAANVSWTSQAATSVTFTGNTGTPFSGSAVTVTGGTTGLTFTASTPNLTLGGTLNLVNGGTNASLTASNGGIVYSTATALAILAGTATANQILLSGASGAPTWSTATYPATAGTSGNVLTSNGTNWTSAAPPSGKAFSIVIQVFTSNGTYTPTAGMVNAIGEVVGGGAGGGGCENVVAGGCGAGGGGAGSYARKNMTAAAVGASQTITIGAAGTGGAAGNNNGTDGSDTSIGTLCIGKGGTKGNGGAAGNVGGGGAGGVVGTGDATIAGQNGGAGINSLTNSQVPAAGTGGMAFFGGGNGTQVNNTGGTTAGNTPSGYGCGGNGGVSFANGGAVAGGPGKAGYVIITEYVYA